MTRARARRLVFVSVAVRTSPTPAKQLIAPLAQFGVKDVKTDMEWGTDHFDFMLEGVPTFVAEQEEANYLENYHAVSDTYDKVDFPS